MITNHVGFYHSGTTVERAALTPKVSSLFWDTDLSLWYIWDGSAWSPIAASVDPVNLRNILELEFDNAIELTIVAGAITRTQVYHRVDTQGDDATDNLDTINGGTEADILIIRAENAARTVVVRTGVGNIVLQGGSNISLDDVTDHLILIYDGTQWNDLGGGGGGGGGGGRCVD